MYARCDEHNADAIAGSYPAGMFFINNIIIYYQCLKFNSPA